MASLRLSKAMLSLFCLVSVCAPSFAATTELISISSTGGRADDSCVGPDVSDDGRFVVFHSGADNLVPGDANGFYDVFLRDRQTQQTTRVSFGLDGCEPNGDSFSPLISSSGDFVLFTSAASNLVPDDTNGVRDVFRWERETNSISRLSQAYTGGEADGASGVSFLSSDDRYLVISSQADNLVADDSNAEGDVFVLDLEAGGIELVSTATDGSQGDSESAGGVISADGSVVAFTSYARNLVSDDTNFRPDVFVRRNEQTTRVSISSDGTQADDGSSVTDITADGRNVLFGSHARNLVAPPTVSGNVFLRDLQNDTTSLVSVGSDGLPGEFTCGDSAISADGHYVVFSSESDGLVPDDQNFGADVFIRDLMAERTTLISRANDGSIGYDGAASDVSITSDGRYVAFASYAHGLAPGDEDWWAQIFLRDRLTFEDVPLDYWAFYEVGGCHMPGVVRGYEDGLYHPNITVTRDQMAVYIARALAGPTPPAGPAEPTFTDVPADFWAYDAIEYCAANDIVEGYGAGNYEPGWQVTRGQMAVFIARSIVSPTGEAGLESYDPPETPSFLDVPTDYWSYKHVEYLSERGIVKGYPDYFGPGQNAYLPTQAVDRAQMAVYIQRAFELPI